LFIRLGNIILVIWQKMNRFKTILLILISLAIISSCKVSERATGSKDVVRPAQESPKIIFLNYSISENKSNQNYTVQLIDKTIVHGKIKKNANIPITPAMDDLAYSVSDKDKMVLEENFVENPLRKTFEFVDDNGQLAKKDVVLDSAQFSLRLQLDPKARYISLARYFGPERENQVLHVFEITEDDLK